MHTWGFREPRFEVDDVGSDEKEAKTVVEPIRLTTLAAIAAGEAEQGLRGMTRTMMRTMALRGGARR